MGFDDLKGKATDALGNNSDKVEEHSDQGLDKAGGYGIQGPAGAFVQRIVGSHPAVMGLPLYEAVQLLRGVGWRR